MLNKKYKEKKLKNLIAQNINFSFILIFTSAPNQNSVWELLIKYYHIWPPFQWITSLVTLILIYWMSGYFYNKLLSQKGGWMDTKTRIIMIIIDLVLNFSLGVYYMNFRDTFIGALMIQCPVFLLTSFLTCRTHLFLYLFKKKLSLTFYFEKGLQLFHRSLFSEFSLYLCYKL